MVFFWVFLALAFILPVLKDNAMAIYQIVAWGGLVLFMLYA